MDNQDQEKIEKTSAETLSGHITTEKADAGAIAGIIYLETPKQKQRRDRREQQARTRINKERFLEIFGQAMGITKVACQSLNIGRSTFYEWYQEDKEFAQKVDIIRRDQRGEVEDRLLTAIANDAPWAISLYLNRKHPDYRPKQEQYIIPTEKTLEDLFDEYDKKHGEKSNKQGDNREAPKNKE
jgi:hypothetical protein